MERRYDVKVIVEVLEASGWSRRIDVEVHVCDDGWMISCFRMYLYTRVVVGLVSKIVSAGNEILCCGVGWRCFIPSVSISMETWISNHSVCICCLDFIRSRWVSIVFRITTRSKRTSADDYTKLYDDDYEYMNFRFPTFLVANPDTIGDRIPSIIVDFR